jgi:putative ABC transport system substrate-binding protein
VDVFVVPGPAAARAVRRATPIPLVAVGLPPVERDPDLFASLARPGCSVTGFASFGEEMSAKRIEFLRRMGLLQHEVGTDENGHWQREADRAGWRRS